MKEFIKQELKRNFPRIYRAGKVLFRGAKMLGLAKPLMKVLSKTAIPIPSYADGGLIKAPRQVGKIVKVHNGELIVPKSKVAAVLKRLPYLLGKPGHGRRRPKMELVRPQVEGGGMQKPIIMKL